MVKFSQHVYNNYESWVRALIVIFGIGLVLPLLQVVVEIALAYITSYASYIAKILLIAPGWLAFAWWFVKDIRDCDSKYGMSTNVGGDCYTPPSGGGGGGSGGFILLLLSYSITPKFFDYNLS